jgi:hypothetical protein
MSNYFKQVPDFEYVSRLPDAKISDYIPVKNLFKKGYLRDDIFQDLTFFTKYQVQGDDRPDNIAYSLYDDASLDWVILLSNNIINIQTEWPMPQADLDRYLLEKYGSYEAQEEIHHYETQKVKNSSGVVVVEEGLTVESDFSVEFYDWMIDSLETKQGITTPISNYEYELKIEDAKRNIFALKPRYLNIVKDDMEEMMAYKKGSTSYISETLKRAENIRLYS